MDSFPSNQLLCKMHEKRQELIITKCGSQQFITGELKDINTKKKYQERKEEKEAWLLRCSKDFCQLQAAVILVAQRSRAVTVLCSVWWYSLCGHIRA